jgi:hypothetical protein
MWKTYKFKVSGKDDNYDACKIANTKISGPYERLLSESSRPYMLAYIISVHSLTV